MPFLIQQERTKGNWMFYIGQGMWCPIADIHQAEKFNTEEEATNLVATLQEQAEWAIKHMDFIPCLGAYKILPI